MRARHAIAALTVAAITVTTATACSAFNELSAAQKLHDGVEKLNNSKEVTIDFQITATPDELLAFDAANSSDTSKMTRAQAKQIAGLGITLEMRSKKPLKDVLAKTDTSTGKVDPDLNLGLALHNGNHKNLAEFRTVKGTGYVKLDLMELAKLGGDSKSANEIKAMQAETDSLPRYMKPLKSLMQGDWISIDPTKFAELSKQATDDTPASPMPSLNPSQQQKITDTLSKIFVKDATLTDKGSRNGLDTIEIKTNARNLIADIQKQVFPLFKDVPGFDSKMPTEAPTSVPTTPATITVQLNKDKGTLNNISTDLSQFDVEGKGTHFPIAINFKNTAAHTTAPAGAINFDPSLLEGMFGPSLED